MACRLSAVLSHRIHDSAVVYFPAPVEVIDESVDLFRRGQPIFTRQSLTRSRSGQVATGQRDQQAYNQQHNALSNGHHGVTFPVEVTPF